MTDPIDLDFLVYPSSSWDVGYISSEDTHCFVKCPCGEEFSVNEVVKKCSNCGRMYWTEFICYRMETREQNFETWKMKREHEDE